MLNVELQVIGILITLAFLGLMGLSCGFVKPGVPIEIWRNQSVMGSAHNDGAYKTIRNWCRLWESGGSAWWEIEKSCGVRACRRGRSHLGLNNRE